MYQIDRRVERMTFVIVIAGYLVVCLLFWLAIGGFDGLTARQTNQQSVPGGPPLVLPSKAGVNSALAALLALLACIVYFIPVLTLRLAMPCSFAYYAVHWCLFVFGAGACGLALLTSQGSGEGGLVFLLLVVGGPMWVNGVFESLLLLMRFLPEFQRTPDW